MKFFAYILVIICSVCLSFDMIGQQIWPGDVDNNGRVSEVDFLYWGYAYGKTGPQRVEQGTDWKAYDPPAPWTEEFPNGLNLAWADANGNGLVDDDDEESCIDEYFGLEHGQPGSEGYQNAPPTSSAPRIILEPDIQAVEEGAEVNISLSIDDAGQPLDSFYGIALTLTYSTGLIEGNEGPDFELESGTWLDQDGDVAEELFVETGFNGKGALAITRTNQIGVAVGSGEIGVFQIVIEDIIVGLEIDTFFITVDSVRLVGPNLGTVPVIPDTTSFLIAKDLDLITRTIEGKKSDVSLKIWPNPARQKAVLNWDSKIESIYCSDAFGKHVQIPWVYGSDTSSATLDLNGVPSGVYWLTVKGQQNIINTTIIII